MMFHLVQISNRIERRVALVEEPCLYCLDGVNSVYELVVDCLRSSQSFYQRVRELATNTSLAYNEIYGQRSEWRLLPPIDVPGAPEKMLVSGTGLTHLGSAKDRQSMHLKRANDPNKPVTDSMRMFEWGVAGGRPAEGTIGIAPEWFYKGSGTVLRAPFEPLPVPSHAEDGGEEAELAGVYIVGEDGTPVRLGICGGNEFSDHKFERRNYLNLAGSKLRACSIGPELVVGADFGSATGDVRIERAGKTIWSKAIESGEENMAHSLANIEHHHFKFEGHRIPGHVHIHFFGAYSLSFGEGVELQDGDWMQVKFAGYGRPLRNPIAIQNKGTDKIIRAQSIT